MTHYSPVVSGSASLKALSHAAHLSYCIVAGLGIDPWVEHAESVKTHTLEGLVCVFCLCGKGMSLHSLMTFRNEYILLLPMYIA